MRVEGVVVGHSPLSTCLAVSRLFKGFALLVIQELVSKGQGYISLPSVPPPPPAVTAALTIS